MERSRSCKGLLGAFPYSAMYRWTRFLLRIGSQWWTVEKYLFTSSVPSEDIL